MSDQGSHVGGLVTSLSERSSDRTERVIALASASNPKWQRGYSRLLLFSDLAAVVTAVGIAHWIRVGLSDTPYVWALDPLTYSWVSVLIAAGWTGALAINDARSERVIGSGLEEYRRVWIATMSVFGTIAIISTLFKLGIARGYLLIALPVGIALLLLSRWAARQMISRARRKDGRYITPVLAVGSSESICHLAKVLAQNTSSGYTVVGACVAGQPTESEISIPGAGRVPVVGDGTDISKAVESTQSAAVAVMASEQFYGRCLQDLSWELERLDIDLLVAPGVIDVAGPRLHMWPVAGLPLIHVEKPRYQEAKRFQKRLFDIVFSSLVLLVGFPVMVVVAMAIRLTSKGPVFYRQERIGLNGNKFEILKFRTMIDGADAALADLVSLDLVTSPRDPFKFIDDPRVTSIGRFLRKHSLDELPQFINVLKRDMSVVGPRPQVRSEVEAYDDYAKKRLLVPPGITGLWQVSGRSDLSWEDSMRLDLFYVENWSMATDLLIALKTAQIVITRSGAY